MALVAAGCAEPGVAPRPPNVVVLLADDLGWRDTGAYGSRFHQTPNIDRLAAEGLRFTNAYTASPLCSPARASIISGLDPARIGFTAPFGHVPEVVLESSIPAQAPAAERSITPVSLTRLPRDVETTAERLREAGYATGFFGKWHLGTEEFAAGARGFDVDVPGSSLHAPPSHFTPYGIPGLANGPYGEQLDQRLAAEAVSFMQEHADAPFLLHLWLFSVHFPYQGDRELVAKHRARIQRGDPQRNAVMAAMIESMDGAVGTVVDALDALGLREDTVVVFLSDNGGVDWHYDPQARGPLPTDNAPLRGGKGQVYEGGIRVPWIVRWPGRVEPGSRSAAFVTTSDLHPSTLEWAGLAPRPDRPVDGQSLAPLLRGGPWPRESVFVHFPHYMLLGLSPPASAVRHRNWKLIRFYGEGKGQGNRHELYRLADDEGETRDLARRHPQRVAELGARLDAHLAAIDARIPRPNPAWRPAP